MSSDDSNMQEKRKRMRLALCADANVAAANSKSGNEDPGASNIKVEDVDQPEQENDGVFVGGFPVKRFSGINLKAMADGAITTEASRYDIQVNRNRERADNLNSSFQTDSTNRDRCLSFSLEPFQVGDSSTMKHSASFASIAELFEDTGKRDRSLSVEESTEVTTAIDEAIDSMFESSKTEYKGKFLETISIFLSDNDAPFQHIDLWVPMDVGSSASVTATSSTKVNGVIYGGQQDTTIRLSHAGFITIRGKKMLHRQMHRLNEVRALRGANLLSFIDK